MSQVSSDNGVASLSEHWQWLIIARTIVLPALMAGSQKTDCMNEATLGAQELFHSGKIGEDSSRLDRRGFLTGTEKVGFDHQTGIDLF
jgi:hypothetical protein